MRFAAQAGRILAGSARRVGMVLSLTLVFTGLSGCRTGEAGEESPTSRLPAAYRAPADDAKRPAVLVGGEALHWEDLRPALSELGGAAAVEEAALSIALRQELDRRGITVDQGDVDAERSLFVSALSAADRSSTQAADELLTRVRERRGLGDHRFAALLQRNAMLRALVRADAATSPDAEPLEDDLRTAYEIKHGARVVARLIVVATLADAERAAARIPAESFARVASEVSIDPTAVDAGLLGAVSAADPSLPLSVRRELERLEPGQTSQPIGVSWADRSGGSARNGYALVQVERRVPAPADAPSFDRSRADLVREIATVRERAAMERAAQQILSRLSVRVLDPDLGASWDRRSGSGR